MFLPVRLSVLAPLEVDAKNPYVVTSAINGVIEEVKVFPNDKVSKEELLAILKYSLDEKGYEAIGIKDENK